MALADRDYMRERPASRPTAPTGPGLWRRVRFACWLVWRRVREMLRVWR